VSDVVFDASEIYRLSAQMANAAPIIAKHSEIGMRRAVVAVQRDAMAEVVVDMGHLRRSITTRVVNPFLGHIGSNLIYARSVEQGWPPNYRWIPKGALLPWMQRKGIPESAEYLIRRKIFREGLPARPFLVPALEANRELFYREMALRMKLALAEITARR
jgi:hypothetical protein